MIDADRFLEDLTGRFARNYTLAISDMVVAIARNNRPQLADVRKRLAKIIAETMGTAEVLGATQVLRAAAGLREREIFRDVFGRYGDQQMHLVKTMGWVQFKDAAIQTILPRVTFVEALQDMVDRTPTVIRNAAERTAKNIARLYGEGAGGIPRVAFVRSAEQAVTDRVQSLIAEAIREGVSETEAGKLIRLGVDEIRKKTAAWSEGYARMAFRTNVNTAVTAGRFRQAQDPDIRQVIPAFRFDSVGDADTRDNHDAADGLIFLSSNRVWEFIAPPLGYNSFVPGTRVAGHVDTASKATYSGPLVVIKTREGRGLTVTPNHPILTAERGFAAAGDVRKGDHCIRHLPTDESLTHRARYRSLSAVEVLRRAVHDQQVIPRIEDVFSAARMQGTRPVVEGLARPLALDFHGDAGFYQGEVHVVSLDRLLPDDRTDTQAFAEGTDQRSLMQSGDTPGFLAHHSSLAVSGGGGLCLLGSTPQVDPTFLEPFADSIACGAYVLGELQDRFAGEISLDEVVSVDVVSYSGHVYDLQSPLSWIVANGYVASNCRCQVSFVGLPELRRMGRVGADGSIREDRLPTAAHPDEGFRHGGRPDLALSLQ